MILSTSKGSAAQIIEGKEQYLLFNNNGIKADFLGERVSDVRRKKEGANKKNINKKELSKEEKQDNVIVVVQVPLKQKKLFVQRQMSYSESSEEEDECDDDAMFNMDEDQKENDKEVNVEAAIVKVAERTNPVCICGKDLQKYQVQYAYGGNGINCNKCRCKVNNSTDLIYHCVDKKNNYKHPRGYDLCIECGEKQLKFDELRGMLEEDENYKLERNEKYPIRVTLQYYKATNNGEVNKEVIDDIVAQLESSQKMADNIGSLVTEYDPNRATEWINNKNDDEKGDQYAEIKKSLQENCGSEWETFYKNFVQEQVTDNDVKDLSNDDLKDLITKMGPRNRFKKWIQSL